MSQAALARNSGVAQSVISVYESGRRQPSLPMLAKLVRPTGYELDVRLRRIRDPLDHLTGPLGRVLRHKRLELLAVASRHDVVVRGVFGSTARCEDGPNSDIDLLVDYPNAMGLLGIARFKRDLTELLDSKVDLIPADGLKPAFIEAITADLIPL